MAVGGYAPALSSFAPVLDNDLYLDWRRLWLKWASTDPNSGNGCFLTLIRSEICDKSTLHWGPVYDADFSQYNIYPAWKSIQTHQHRVGFELSRECVTLDCAISRFWISTSSPMVSTRPMGVAISNRPDSLSFRSDETSSGWARMH